MQYPGADRGGVGPGADRGGGARGVRRAAAGRGLREPVGPPRRPRPHAARGERGGTLAIGGRRRRRRARARRRWPGPGARVAPIRLRRPSPPREASPPLGPGWPGGSFATCLRQLEAAGCRAPAQMIKHWFRWTPPFSESVLRVCSPSLFSESRDGGELRHAAGGSEHCVPRQGGLSQAPESVGGAAIPEEHFA